MSVDPKRTTSDTSVLSDSTISGSQPPSLDPSQVPEYESGDLPPIFESSSSGEVDATSSTGAVKTRVIRTVSQTSSSSASSKLSQDLIAKKVKSVKEFKRKMKEKYDSDSGDSVLGEEYHKGLNCGELVRKKTGIVYSDKLIEHFCEWDKENPEKPERYTAVMERLVELLLVERCQRIEPIDIKSDDIFKVHDFQQLAVLRRICIEFEPRMAEIEACKYDSIYFNKATYDCAKMAVNLTVSLSVAIWRGEVQNGMAIVRPPGHHALHKEYNGYCYLNNVAIAATYLVNHENANKIMIVDFDVHHGQGTQYTFYEDDRVLYFSIHRYEHAKFWPNLRQSSFDYIGEGRGMGHNINVPLNKTGMGDAEYMAIVNHILMPVAYEYQPEIIIFSAGYDACIGCPEGEMNVTPGFYGHLIKLLSGLCEGKLQVVLEGGYFLPSLAEGAAMTLRALLDDAPAFLEPLGLPDPEVVNTINDVKFSLHDSWKCFKIFDTFENPLDPAKMNKDDPVHIVRILYEGVLPRPPFFTRCCYPTNDSTKIVKFKKAINDLKIAYGLPKANKVCYTYHTDMLLHTSSGAVENHRRLEVVHRRFLELNLDTRCTLLETAPLNLAMISAMVHDPVHLENLCKVDFPVEGIKDLYWCAEASKMSITKAVGATMTTVDAVMSGEYTSGVAIIRPPGHHAGAASASGFCFLNNVAIAAQHIIDKYNTKRVLIIDFDLHHGNGTQEIFYKSKKVLYVSIHKFETGTFFPCSTDGDIDHVGEGQGEGFNVNIPFNKDKMGDAEYMSAFHRIVLPIAYSYAPEVVLVSAGFDAGVNDLLGNYKVNPETFGHFVQMLRGLAGGKLIVAMEGGYNLTTLEHSMNFCIKALLGDPLPKLENLGLIRASAYKTFEKVIAAQKKYWPVLAVDKLLPDRISELHVKTSSTEFRICDPKQKLTASRVNELMIQLNLDE